ELAERDARDASRAVAPLRPAPGALHLDSDTATPEQLVERIVAALEEVTP
ncbi:MAG: (d)CMP kinase, partial [Planctomycetota bacterium]|nr:(d)CMP kinase [Planctomycetota bacterium]